MTNRLHPCTRTSRTALVSGNARVYSTHSNGCILAASSTGSGLTVAHQRGVRIEDIGPKRSKRSGRVVATTRIAAAMGQLTHSHR